MASGSAGHSYSGDLAAQQVLVKFVPTLVASQFAAIEDGFGAKQAGAIPDLGVQILSVPAGAAASVAAALANRPDVVFAEPDGVATVSSTVTPDDYYYPAEWGLPKTNMPTAWSTTEGSSSVVVAVIDSGLTSSADLEGNVVQGWNFLTGTSDTTDDFGHGTQVAGVTAAKSNNSIGVTSYCWQCSLMPLEVVDSSGSATMSNVASSITWATDHGARVINLSLGGSATSTVQSAVSYAESKGVVLVASAGNSACDCAQYPAAYAGVLSVAATDSSDQLESYSNYGPWVQVTAPGTTYTVTRNGTYGSFGGTSAAAPAVAGIAGLLESADPSASASEVVSAIENSAVRVGTFVAHGRVDGAAALGALAGSGGGQSGGTSGLPGNTIAPAISGSAEQGQTLAASTGSWSGSPTSYAYKWLRCGSASCVAVSGATASTYPVGSADVGSTMEVSVTASNSAGSGSAVSAPTATVAASTQTLTFSGSLSSRKTSQTYSFSTGTGSDAAMLTFSKCSSLALQLVDSSGTVVDQASGPSGLSLTDPVNAGSYSYKVSGACKTSFGLTVTTPSP